MSLKIVVLAKQVPDTRNVGKEAMRTDGTINRGALAAVFNPEDLNALEMALSIKDLCNAEVHVLTMGPPRAAEIVREAIFRGADSGAVISDSRFAGSDTLATSYALSMAIKKLDFRDELTVSLGKLLADFYIRQIIFKILAVKVAQILRHGSFFYFLLV